MSKTYTLTATVTCKSGVARSTTLANATTDYTTDKRIGSTGASNHYSCILAFNSTQMAHLRGLASSAITSATLEVSATTAASGAFHPFYGAKKATGTSSAEISSSNQVAVAKNATKITIDVKSLGFPSTNAYCIGSQANISGETYATMRGITATLTVVTTENDITLSYNANGGSGAPSSQSATAVGSHTFTISDTSPTRTGYTFLGWSKSSSATTASYQPGGTISISSSTTLYAVWSIIKYDITYKPGASATSGSQTVVKKSYGVTAYLLNISDTDIERTGYHATGWAKTDGGAQAYSFGQQYTTNSALTVYPAWTANEYTVSFDSQGGSAVSSITVTYGSTYGTLPVPTWTGHTFIGWYTELSGGTQITAESIVSILNNQTLYARYTSTASDDLHYKHGGSIYGGETWVKRNGQMYRGEVWHKADGHMYKGG